MCVLLKDVVILPEGKLNVSHISYYAIYDGHGGTDCAEFLSNVLFQVIIQNVVETPNDVEGAMRKAFEDCDKAIVSKLGNDGLSVGSTAGLSFQFVIVENLTVCGCIKSCCSTA